MIDKLLDIIRAQFPLTEMSCGQYHNMKLQGKKFVIRRFKAAELGSVTTITTSAFFGLVKTDTLIISPSSVDMPLLSYDRARSLGEDTMIFELYDTLLEQGSYPALAEAKLSGKDLPDHALGSHWYDPIKLPLSMAKKGQKEHTAEFDRLAQTYLLGYLDDAKNAAACEESSKKEKNTGYVESLLEHSSPFTEVFQKNLGTEKTADLFHRILFATNP